MGVNYATKKALIRMFIIMGILLGTLFGVKLAQHLFLSWYLSKHATPTVATTRAKAVVWQPFITATATLRAANGVKITTATDGIIENIVAVPGAAVHKGELILNFVADAEQANLRGLLAEAQLAQITYTRDLAQYAVQAISKQELDTDLAHLRYAIAQVDQQRGIVKKKFIKAPFDGTLGIIALSPGAYVQAGTVISSLHNLDIMYADFYVPQQMVAKIAVGQAVKLYNDTYPDQVFTGKITTINPDIDATTRNLHIEACLMNKNHNLLPGMFATIKIFTDKPQQFVVIPQSAIDFRPYGAVIFVVEHHQAQAQVKQSFITTGETRDNLVNVLKGIAIDDEVVLAGQDKLKDGSNVVINNDLVH